MTAAAPKGIGLSGLRGCLSHYFKRHRAAYYDHLQAVRERGDWEGWLAFFLRGVNEVSAEATETARRVLALREEHRALIAARLGRGAGTGHRLLEHLDERPIVSIEDVRSITGVTYAAASGLVRRLVEHGVVAEMTGQRRHRRFRYDPYVRLFDEPQGVERA